MVFVNISSKYNFCFICHWVIYHLCCVRKLFMNIDLLTFHVVSLIQLYSRPFTNWITLQLHINNSFPWTQYLTWFQWRLFFPSCFLLLQCSHWHCKTYCPYGPHIHKFGSAPNQTNLFGCMDMIVICIKAQLQFSVSVKGKVIIRPKYGISFSLSRALSYGN